MGGLDGLIHDDRTYMCPFMPAIPCEFGQGSRCKGCENNPETFIENEELRKEFKAHPWAPYCLTCGEFDAISNHPGHVVAIGYEEYKEKIPEMIMDRIKRRNEPSEPIS